MSDLTPQDVKVEATNGGGAPVAQAVAAKAIVESKNDDFDFLSDD